MAQRAPVEAAEPARQEGAAAAQHRLHREAAGDREVRARAAQCAPDVDAAARRHEQRTVVRKAAVELGAAQRDQRVLLERELRADHGQLQRRLVARVAHQRVGERQGHRIHGAARAQAEVLQAVAAVVLQRAEQAGTQDADAHPRISWNSSLDTARKRTRSPEPNRLGSRRAASNTVSGVRPITFQPPEMAYG